MIKCPDCGRENDDSFKFCLDCGHPLTAQAPPAKAAAPPVTEPPLASPIDPAPAAEASEPAGQALTSQLAAAPYEAPQTAQQPAEPTPAPAPPAQPPAPAVEQATCPNCAAAVRPDNAFCASCGQNLKEPPTRRETMFMHTASPEEAAKPKVRLVLIKPDGSEGTVFTLAEKTTIGRTEGMIMFPKDLYISPRHAELQIEGDKLIIRDLDSLNGIYRKMTSEVGIVPGTYFRIGRQLLRLEVPGDFEPLNVEAPQGDDSRYWGSLTPQVWARLVQVLEGGKIGEIHLLTQAEVTIGREEGEVRFPEDGFISSEHCKLINTDGNCSLVDLSSSNGTYLRIDQEHELGNGDSIQIGNQVLRVDVQ